MYAIDKCAIEFVESELVLNERVITENSFKRFTLSVISDFAFSGCVDKQWLEQALHHITHQVTLQFMLVLILGNVTRYLPTPFNIREAIMRWKMSRFLAQRSSTAPQRRESYFRPLRPKERHYQGPAACRCCGYH